ncbi:MAG: sugar phosphate isomerase/epimerase [Verrucomicrobiota bacterium]
MIKVIIPVACATLLLTAGRTVAAVGIGPSFKGPLGLQLYSLRAEFGKDVPGTMDLVKQLGFQYAELAGTYKLAPEKLKAELDARGIKAVAGHFSYDLLRDNPEAVAKDAKAMGLSYVGFAWIPHQGKFTEKTAREAAAVLNKAGEVFAKYGMKAYYHNHGYEFEPYGDGTLMDLLIQETKPELVTFEMDILWVYFPAQDPAKLLKKHPGRWELVHLKDLKKGVATGELTGKTDVKNDVALGAGQIDLKAMLKAGAEVGVKYYFIEDESPTVKEQLPQSLKFLESVTW